jgi:hypothetical protein
MGPFLDERCQRVIVTPRAHTHRALDYGSTGVVVLPFAVKAM